jgi:hypothetical protein
MRSFIGRCAEGSLVFALVSSKSKWRTGWQRLSQTRDSMRDYYAQYLRIRLVRCRTHASEPDAGL